MMKLWQPFLDFPRTPIQHVMMFTGSMKSHSAQSPHIKWTNQAGDNLCVGMRTTSKRSHSNVHNILSELHAKSGNGYGLWWSYTRVYEAIEIEILGKESEVEYIRWNSWYFPGFLICQSISELICWDVEVHFFSSALLFQGHQTHAIGWVVHVIVIMQQPSLHIPE